MEAKEEQSRGLLHGSDNFTKTVNSVTYLHLMFDV